MKTELCYNCDNPVKVEEEYEPEGCCDGRECGCGVVIYFRIAAIGRWC